MSLPRAVAIGLAGLFASAAMATVPPPRPPHHPELALCALGTLVDAIGRRDPAILSDSMKIYSNELGEVTSRELTRFFDEFAGTSGREPVQPLRLWDWAVLQAAEITPLYVVTLRRGAMDGGHWSVWLVQFASDRIVVFRRADELWPFAIGAVRFHSSGTCRGSTSNG